MKSQNSFIQFFFFGNYFYGLCAASLTIESLLQLQYPFYAAGYFLALFFATIVYYNNAYNVEEVDAYSSNLRTKWYVRHRSFVFKSQVFFILIFLCWAICFIVASWDALWNLSVLEIALILLFPATAALYNGSNRKFFRRYNLRSIGWIKPFIIGFTWAGVVTIYPAIYYAIVHQSHFKLSQSGSLMLLMDFIFISLLCIMFDIKDYAGDSNRELKTFVVKVGLRKTIYFILIPLTFLGIVLLMINGLMNHFSIYKIALQLMPFSLLIAVANSMQKRRQILYYLVLIDGLMLVKAICGIIAVLYF